MSDGNRSLVVRILFGGAALLALLAVLCWTGVLPIEHGARRVMTLAFGLAAAGDVLIGLVLLARSRSSS